MSAPRDFTLTIGAGDTGYIEARGRFVGLIEAPGGAVFISLDNGPEYRRGASGTIFQQATFSRVAIRSTVAQTVRVVIAQESQSLAGASAGGGSGSSGGPFNTLPAGGDVSVAATTTALVSAADASRVGIVIKNPVGNTAAVRVGGASVGAASGVELQPGESVTLATIAAVYVYNSHSAAQSVNVLPLQQV